VLVTKLLLAVRAVGFDLRNMVERSYTPRGASFKAAPLLALPCGVRGLRSYALT
jgi:hypothetical protein